MRHVLVLLLLGVTTVAGAACSAVQTPSGPSAVDAGGLSLAGELSYCVDETNRYRVSVGLPPLKRSQALEDFAADAAEHDHQVRSAHQHFASTNGGGVARAETEILWWRHRTVREVVHSGLAEMWRVGPGGEHYDIMAGGYTETGCGVYVDESGVTVAQDFR